MNSEFNYIENKDMELDPEIKAKWMEALQSGRYKQCRNMLRNDYEGYCCLGVLADVVAPEKWDRNEAGFSHDDYNQMLSTRFINSVGLNPDLACKLADWNDSGKDFKFIAEYIQDNL